MIKNDIRNLIRKATQLPVWLANENGKKPPKPFMMLYVQNAQRLPLHASRPEEDGQQGFITTYSAHRDANCQLQCFGEGSYDELDMMGQRFKGQTMLDAAGAVNMAIENIGIVQDVPVLRDAANYEPRAILEFTVRYTMAHTEPSFVIEKTNIGMATQGSATELPDIKIEV